MSFYSHYELLEPLPGKTVKTFKGRQLTSGRFVMVHLLVGETAALERARASWSYRRPTPKG